MPVCFQLVNRGTAEATSLTEVDNLLCQAFNVPPDPIKWYNNWYNAVGVCLAFGDTIETIKESWLDDELMVKILDWIDQNYTIKHWRE